MAAQLFKDAHNREMFLGLAVVTFPILTIIRIAARVFCLFTGDFIRVAKAAAEKEWEVDWLKSAVDPKIYSVPSVHAFRFKVLCYALAELVLEVGKIVTYPVAGLLLALSALWGALVDSADGGALWALIERTWGRPPAYFSNPETLVNHLVNLEQISDFCLLCRQPIWFNEACGNFSDKMYKQESLRALIYQLKQEITVYKEHFSLLGIKCDAFLDVLQQYRAEILFKLTPHDYMNEYIREGVEFHANIFKKRLSVLKEMRTSWQQHIQALQRGDADDTGPDHTERVAKINRFSLACFPPVLKKD